MKFFGVTLSFNSCVSQALFSLIANISSIPSIYGPEFDINADTFYENIGEVFPPMLQANFGDEDFSPIFSKSSPSVKPYGTKLWI